MQDGDIDGCMFMGRPPTKAEAEVIRSGLGILKKREVGELELERLRTQMAWLQRAAGRRVRGSRLTIKWPSGSPETASDDPPATRVAKRRRRRNYLPKTARYVK